MIQKIFLLLLVSCIIVANINAATISGKITNEAGEALPFASVYIKGTSVGTSSNEDGFYTFEVKSGNYELVFQYVGYQIFSKKITVKNSHIELNAILESTQIQLTEVVVNADEDPAYRVIREAIKKRKYYKNLVQKHSCNAYVKGTQRLKDTPATIFGMEVGDLGGMVDSNGQGILYLSESVSEVYFESPNQYREVMISSKISGDDNGFSFNQASSINFNFYENSIQINRAVVSPIADNALSFYKYKLEGYFDENGYKINKIKVIPKDSYAATMGGYIYIVEDLWNIHSTDLFLTGRACQVNILDTMYFKQVYVPVRKPDIWLNFSTTLQFDLSLFMFKVEGNFSGVFKDYNLDVNYPKGFFNNEILKIEEGSNERTETYWDSIRPMPLTQDETIDYIKKDSINTIMTSEPYLDSMDNIYNRFLFENLVLGYTYRQTIKRQSFSIGSPLLLAQYNTVQGFVANLKGTYKKEFEANNRRWLEIEPSVQYGFSDKRVRGGLRFTYNANKTNFSKITLSGGNEIAQFNEDKPICDICNAYQLLTFRTNWARLYEKEFAKIEYEQELFNGVFFKGGVEYAARSVAQNNSDFFILNIFDRGEFAENIPQNEDYNFVDNDAVFFDASVRLRYKQKYITYPKEKQISRSKLPDLWLHYRKGLSTDGSKQTDFDWLQVSMRETFPMTTWGYSSLNIEAGTFLNNNAVSFPDFFHFRGKRTAGGRFDTYYRSFLVMPYYTRSTNEYFAMMHYEHNFNGRILSKVPGCKQLGWTAIIGGKALYTPNQGEYFESHIALGNIGWSFFRIFRVDFAVGFNASEVLNYNVIFGYTL